MLDSMDVVRPVGGGDSKKSALRVALTVASAVGLVTLSAHAYGSQDRTVLAFDPVAAAIASHSGVSPVIMRAAAPKQQLAAMSMSDLNDHPYRGEAEGMPTENGQMISAAQMFEEAGEPAPQHQQQLKSTAAPLRTRVQAIAEANRRMAGGGTMDPEVGLDLDEAFASHDKIDANPAVMEAQASAAVQERQSQQQMQAGLRQQRAAQQRASQVYNNQQQQRAQAMQQVHAQAQSTQPQAHGTAKESAAQIRAKLAAQGGAQGFTLGSHLRVTPDEFHREMKRYMPDASGRLVSPYQWFQSMGK